MLLYRASYVAAVAGAIAFGGVYSSIATVRSIDKQSALPPNFVADVAQLRAALEEGDPSLYRHRSKAAIDSAFSALANSAAAASTAQQFWEQVTATLAFVQDGHLVAMPNGTLLGEGVINALPFTLRVVGDRLYILRNLGTKGRQRAGSEIVGFNGMTAGELISFCVQHISADGVLRMRAYRKIERDFDLSCGLALGTPRTFVVAYTTPGDARIQVDTVPALGRENPSAPSRPASAPEPVGALRFLAGEKIAVMTLHRFSSSDGFNPSSFMNRAFATIADSGISTLVVDLRDNGGGRDGVGAELISHMARDTFTYARRIALHRHFSFVDWATNWRIKLLISTRPLPDGRLLLDEMLDKPQRPTRKPFLGNVIVVADRGTFSTASEVVALMQEYGRATVVGEESATGREGDSGATSGIALKESGFVVDIPLVRYDLPDRNGTPPGRGVLPDIAVAPTIADLVADRDVMMDVALRAARESGAHPARRNR